jgi:hypothetical protein
MSAIMTCRPSGHEAAARIAGWLSLAAAPTFVAMALLTSVAAPPDLLCAPTRPLPGVSALAGMVPMYLLMAAFHAGPWLRLLASRHA